MKVCENLNTVEIDTCIISTDDKIKDKVFKTGQNDLVLRDISDFGAC